MPQINHCETVQYVVFPYNEQIYGINVCHTKSVYYVIGNLILLRGCFMKIPQHATLMLGRNCKYPIETVHFATKLVTLKENEKVFNTVSVHDVRFDYTNFTEAEIKRFQNLLF